METIPASVLYALILISTSLVGMLGGIIARDRQVMKMIHDGDEKNAAELKRTENMLHEKINQQGDRFNTALNDSRESNDEHYVRKEHFQSCVDNLNDGIRAADKKLQMLVDKML